MIRRGWQCNFWHGTPLLSHILAGMSRTGPEPFVSQNTTR